MQIRDWRLVSPQLMAPIYARETERWRARLAWDTASVWARVEEARRLGYLPGLLITDDLQRVRGWSFHLLHGTTLQVGALVTDSVRATTLWLDALARTPEAAAADRSLYFGWIDAPGLADALRGNGCDVQPYEYLLRGLGHAKAWPSERLGHAKAWPSERHAKSTFQNSWGAGFSRPLVRLKADPTTDLGALRAWQTGDLAGVAELLRVAYPGSDETRPFAPSGMPSAWLAYCRQLIEGDANGRFDPELSRVVAGADGLDAAVMVTKLSLTTAHVAQLAVRPELRRQGLARHLLADVLDAADRVGCDTATLLVSAQNDVARAFYAHAGFATRATFLSATGPAPRVYPRRSTSDACVTGAASTRR